MNGKITRFSRLFLFFIFAGIAVFLIVGANKINAANYVGLGEERFTWDREIYEGVSLRHIMSYNDQADQKSYTITFNPKTTKLQAKIGYGTNLLSGKTLSSLIDTEEAKGNHVVFGVNGDAYDTSNFVPNGIVINEGELISTGGGLGWGMYADGTVKYGSASLQMKASIAGGSTINLTHVNKERKTNTSGVYLLTDKFNATTNSYEAGAEVVLTVDAQQNGLRIGQSYNLTVEKVVQVQRNTTGKNQTEIGQGKAVLSTNASSPHYQTLSNLRAGQKITIDINDVNNDGINWQEVQTGMGIFHLLMENGEPTATALNDPAVHPRTSMGVKADGTIILMQNDGRQSGWSNGLTFKEMVDYYQTLGAVTVFNFDGGGSSTISATIPGESKAKMLNRGSDGRERANTNGLLFVATEDKVPSGEVDKIHIYPSLVANYATKAQILENGKLSFYVSGTDANYYPATFNASNISYRVEGDIGSVTQTGEFTAKSGTGSGKVIVSYGDLTAEFEINVVDQISIIETDLTIISASPGKIVPLEFRAYKDGIPIVLTSEALTFRLDPASLGTISAAGVFTATTGSGSGHLHVSYKDFSIAIPVEVGKMPTTICDFEDDIFAPGGGWRSRNNYPERGGDYQMTVNRDENYIKHGDGSLKIDYDFATKPLSGTVPLELYKDGYITLEGQPTAISYWVYGDGNGAWLRMQLAGPSYLGNDYISWTGWKYIEIQIPAELKPPYVLQYPVRLTGTQTIANYKKGAVYIDSIRAIYDFRNDDNDAPIIDEQSIAPLNGATVDTKQPTISFRAFDATVGDNSKTGIDTSRTQMYINNKLVDNLQQTVNSDGSVSVTYIPSALTALRPGKQNIRVRIEDNFGNKTFKEWSFTVEGYAVELTETKPPNPKIYAGEKFTYSVSSVSYQNFEELNLEISYNKNVLNVDSITVDERLNLVNHEIDAANGIIKATVIGMDNNVKIDGTEVINFHFKAKDNATGSTNIVVNKAEIIENSKKVELVLTGYNVPVDYRYTINYEGCTLNGLTKITVLDNGEGVSNAYFMIFADDEIVGFSDVTSSDGTLTTDFFGAYPVGTKFTVQAIKDGLFSNTMKFEILASLGSTVPEKISVTVGTDAGRSVGISYQTAHGVETGYIEISVNDNLANSIRIDTTDEIIRSQVSGTMREYTAWGAYVENLTPDTVYYYRVGNESSVSEVYSFKTAKEIGDMNIAFFGDIQGGYSLFPNVLDKFYNMYPDIELNLLAGDIVENAFNYNEWSSLDQYNRKYLANSIWASAIGNHDTSDDGVAFASYFYGPDNGTSGQTRRNYYFTIGDAIIFNFDSEAGFSSYDTSFTKQKALLKDVMSKTDKGYKIVIMHRSAYPLKYDEPSIRALYTTFEECGIDLVLSGHDHVYSRTTMLGNNKTDVDKGITYVVGGSASGSKYYEGDLTKPWVNIVYDDDNAVYTILKFVDGNLQFEAYAIENGTPKLIDNFQLNKNKINIDESEVNYYGPRAVKTGQSLTFSVEAKVGYVVRSVKVGSTELSMQNGKYVYRNVNGPITIVVETLGGMQLDLNDDGKITAADINMMLKHITGKEKLTEKQLSDKGLSSSDITLMLVRQALVIMEGE